jgi:hypothetical protein
LFALVVPKTLMSFENAHGRNCTASADIVQMTGGLLLVRHRQHASRLIGKRLKRLLPNEP